MDRTRDQFFAGPALALDEHVALVVPEALDRACEGAHPGRGPHEFGRRTPAAQLLLELAISLHEAVALERLAHGGAHAVRIFEGFREVVESPSPHAPNRALDARVPRHHHDLHIGPVALDPIQKLKTRHPAHHEVEQDHLEIGIEKRRLGSRGVLGQGQLVAVGLEDPAESPEHERLIVYQQDEAPQLIGPRGSRIGAGISCISRGQPGGSQLGVHGVLIGPGIGTLEWELPRLEPRTEVSTLRGPPSAARRFQSCEKRTFSSLTMRNSIAEPWSASSRAWGSRFRWPETRARPWPSSLANLSTSSCATFGCPESTASSLCAS